MDRGVMFVPNGWKLLVFSIKQIYDFLLCKTCFMLINFIRNYIIEETSKHVRRKEFIIKRIDIKDKRTVSEVLRI